MPAWHKEMYIDDEISDPDLLKELIDSHAMVFHAWLVILPERKDHLLEMMPALCFSQDLPAFNDCTVIALVHDKERAAEFCRALIEKVYKLSGGFDLKSSLDQLFLAGLKGG